jgi:RimJ/RimL family protein N-acetyltransferase
MGYFIGERYWNKGLTTEAVKRMVTYVFTHFPHLHKIYATPFDFNTASQKVLQKAGFEREAILKQAAIKNGKIIDEHYYSLLKDQWLRLVSYRCWTHDDFPVMEQLQYEAIFIPEGVDPPPFEIIKQPEIDIYIRDFGSKKDDICILATLYGQVVGGVWVRILDGPIKGFGHVDAETPEFAIAVFKEFRSIGIGTDLMLKMIDILRNKGYKQCSLAVQKDNYAVKMYKKVGFVIVEEKETEYIMVCKLKS